MTQRESWEFAGVTPALQKGGLAYESRCRVGGAPSVKTSLL